MKLSALLSVAAATDKTWLTKEWQVQDAYFADQEITLQDPRSRSNKQWHDCGDKPAVPVNGRDVVCNGTVCTAVCPIGWRSQGRWKIKCKADNTWSHSKFSPCVTCPDMNDELDKMVESEIGAVSQSIINKANLPVTQFMCGKSTDKLIINGQVFKKGGQKRNVKCFCKNGQNGDPAWKKSCSWSFQGKPWYPSYVNTVQCIDKKAAPTCEEKYPAPSGYQIQDTNFGRVYYKIHDGLHNIWEARALCNADGSYVHLPIPKSYEQNSFYYNLVGRQSSWDLWLGISDELQEGVWIADDGSGPITYTNWNRGEPNNVFGGTEHWGEMDLLTAGWNDYVAASDPKERLNTSNENKVICTFVVPKKC